LLEKKAAAGDGMAHPETVVASSQSSAKISVNILREAQVHTKSGL